MDVPSPGGLAIERVRNGRSDSLPLPEGWLGSGRRKSVGISSAAIVRDPLTSPMLGVVGRLTP